MSRNRLKSANSLPSHKIWVGLALFFVVTASGLLYGYLQLRINRLASDNKKLELELAEFQQANDRRMLERQKLITPRALERRLAHFRIEMVELNRLQVLDAQSFRDSGVSMLARGPRDGRAGP